MDFEQLDLGWQSAFDAAWKSYLNNTIPIGAVIQNETGTVVSVGQNMIYSKAGTPPQLYNHKLAHAEINSILQINESEHPHIREYILTTTMEPCPLCFGAIVMGNIRYVRYAARDRYAGAAIYNQCLEYIKNKRIQIEGPFENLETIQIAIQTCYELEHNPKYSETVLAEWLKDCPVGVNSGRRLYEEHTLQSLRQKGAEMADVFNHITNILP